MSGSSPATALSVAAAAAVVVAASSLYTRVASAAATVAAPASGMDTAFLDDAEPVGEEDAVYVGLRKSEERRDLAMAIQEVTETLYVVVDADDAHAATQYTIELLDASWDLTVAADKPQLQIKIAAAVTAPHAWSGVFAMPDLSAVFGEYVPARTDAAKRLPRAGLLPVAYGSPPPALVKYFCLGMSYFDDNRGGTEDGSTRHTIVLVQGTFDHLHNGNRRLLSLATGVCSEHLLVGITAAPHLLAAKPFAKLIEPLETRKKHVAAFVASVNVSVAVEFIDVHDRWGPAGSLHDTRVLCVLSSSDIDRWDETRARRFSLGLPLSFVRVVRRTHRATLSSRRIRKMLADKQA